jgi:hypothetical protein
VIRSRYKNDLRLDPGQIRRSINLTAGMIKLVERMRQDAEHEALAAGAWIIWLKYGKFRPLHPISCPQGLTDSQKLRKQGRAGVTRRLHRRMTSSSPGRSSSTALFGRSSPPTSRIIRPIDRRQKRSLLSSLRHSNTRLHLWTSTG